MPIFAAVHPKFWARYMGCKILISGVLKS